MKKFITRLLFFLLPVAMFYMALLYAGYPPIVSRYVSFDAKVFELRKHPVKSVTVLALGSSVTLNNLNSAVITDSLKLPYYNFGTWAMQITDLDKAISGYISLYHPKYVIVASNFADFNDLADASLPRDIRLPVYFLPLYYFVNYTTFEQLGERRQELAQKRNDAAKFDYLSFDKNGGVALNVTKNNRSELRNKSIDSLLRIFPTKNTPAAYGSLSQLANYLQDKHIRLIFAQFPFVSTFVKSKEKAGIIAAHFKKCRAIIEANHGIYVNLAVNNRIPDSLFCDQVHLSSRGAAIATKRLMQEVKPFIR